MRDSGDKTAATLWRRLIESFSGETTSGMSDPIVRLCTRLVAAAINSGRPIPDDVDEAVDHIRGFAGAC